MSKERLVELIKRARALEQLDTLMGAPEVIVDMPKGDEYLANYLIENGVIAPTSKVGDKIYIHQFNNKLKKVVVECEIIEHSQAEELFKVKLSDGRILTLLFQFIGKTVFLTREEAEAKLKESENNA